MTKQYTTFYVDRSLYGIEVLHVQEVIRIQPTTRVPLARAEIHGLMNLRGQIVPTLDLRKRFGLPDRETGQNSVNVIVRSNDGAVSLIADEVADVIEVSDELFETPPETVSQKTSELIAGAYKLPSQLMLALNLSKVNYE